MPVERCTQLALSLRLWLYAATAALFATGVAWLIAHYLVIADSASRELGALSMRLHGGAAMMMLFLTGLAVASHVPGAWRGGKNRLSGATMSALMVALTVTGYCLYYLGGDAARSLASVAHWFSGLLMPALFVWHSVTGRRTRR